MRTTITLILLSFSVLWSDNRSFVWTYEAMTMAPGDAEFEHYFTTVYRDKNHFDRDYIVIHNMELEIGMTRTFDVGIYQQFSQIKNAALAYDKFKVRFRYRLSRGSVLGADPLLYLEYQATPSFVNQTVEGKFVLSRTWHNIIWAVNPGLEWSLPSRETEAFYTAGLTYEISELVKLGLEIKGSEAGHYIGPVISHGNEKRYIAVGSLIILSTATDQPEFMFRSILGIRL
ncbi:MAG: hypothetical protein ACE5D8_08685 [Fidelibacterota bacterium]